MISLFLSAMLLLGTAVYYVFTTWTKKGIRSLSEKELIPSKDLPAVSIIVPARNEGINISCRLCDKALPVDPEQAQTPAESGREAND